MSYIYIENKETVDTNIQSQSSLLYHRIKEFYKCEYIPNNNKIKQLTNILEGKTKLSLRIIDWFVTNYSKKYNTSYLICKTKNEIVEDDDNNSTFTDIYNIHNNIDFEYENDDINLDVDIGVDSNNIDDMVYRYLINNETHISHNKDISNNLAIDICKNNTTDKNDNQILDNENNIDKYTKFVVFSEYRSQLKAYTKKYFDSFCRGDRIIYSYIGDNNEICKLETTLGQLNFFRWAIENNLLTYIDNHYDKIHNDMNETIKKKKINKSSKKRQYNFPQQMNQLSSIPFFKQNYRVVVRFN